MKPVPVPDDQVFSGSRRVTLGAPPGLESLVGPVEALVVIPSDHVESVKEEVPTYMCLIELEPHDLTMLQETGKFWLVTMGLVPPFIFGTYFPKMTLEHECNITVLGVETSNYETSSVVLDNPEVETETKTIQLCTLCGRFKEEVI